MPAGTPPSALPLPPSFPIPTRAAPKGFSLVEIVIAIGIIAFAFVALFGLLPVGLKVFRESVDGANETWILQSLNSMAQVTPWSELSELSSDQGGDIFYFDEEGRLTDTEKQPGEGALKDRRLYAAKMLVEDFSAPHDGGGKSVSKSARRVIAIIAMYPDPGAMKAFEEIKTVEDLETHAQHAGVKCRSFLVAQMDSGL